MTENNRNQEQDMQRSQDRGNSQGQQGSMSGQQQDVSSQNQEDSNPQRGSEWNNYQTREMGPEGGTGEGNATAPRGE